MKRAWLQADPDVRAAIDDAVAQERRRLARDLHDGLAQDLAFIAAYGQRLSADPDSEHPIAIAARRALAVTRGAIADLSATHAASAAAALEQVAHELSSRHGVHVTVAVEGSDVTGPERDELVRIAREAIVNATRHGCAKEIVVSLMASEDAFVLRIDDNGNGIPRSRGAHSAAGLGLRAMRERAQALGGRLIAGSGELGGARIEVVVP
jgi:signal transduction histidine kinase